MNPSPDDCGRGGWHPEPACCDVAAHAALRVPVQEVAGWRRQPGPAAGEPLPPNFLKHADEQTVVGLGAVLRAAADHRLSGPFSDWGVVAAPRFLGRPTMAAALERFAAEGAWGVSPHLIPHRSLHAPSGTLSQALKAHGPNFGAGGGPGGEAELLLAAAALLHGQRLPGVWAVCTRLEPELPPQSDGCHAPGTDCLALALALRPADAAWEGLRLRLTAGVGVEADPPTPFGLGRLAAMLQEALAGDCPRAEPGLGVRLELALAGAEGRAPRFRRSA